MEFIPIFAVPNPKLYAVLYDGEEKDAFWQLFDNWQDSAYLFNFFSDNEKDLQNGFYNRTVMQAVKDTKEEATDFRDIIIEAIDNAKNEESVNINELFSALSQSEYQLNNHKKLKAYGPNDKTWLRIYAIQVDGCFLITGGAIKLTKRMDDRSHTLEQLKKLEWVKNELKTQGIYFEDGLVE